MPCYECGEPAKYVCHTCGGLVCDKHGARINSNNVCLCNRCPRAELKPLAEQLLACLDTPALLSQEEQTKLERLNQRELSRLLRGLV